MAGLDRQKKMYCNAFPSNSSWSILYKWTLGVNTQIQIMVKKRGVVRLVQGVFGSCRCCMVIQQVKDLKYLGLTVKENLNWKLHIDN